LVGYGRQGADVDRPEEAASSLAPTADGTATMPFKRAPVVRGPVRGALRRLLRDRSALVGLGTLVLLVVAAVFAPALAPYSPTEPHYEDALRGPGRDYLLGTDGLGRDELSRLLFGARISLASVTMAAAAITLLGVTIGLLSGYYGGILDGAIQRVIDVLLAVPSLVLALAIAGMLGPSIRSVLIGVVAVQWVSYARLVRGMVLSARSQPYVESSIALGARSRRVMFNDILPNVLPPVVVLATLEMGGLLLSISSLSFLGLGAQPPTPEWGTMLNQARPFFQSHPYLMIVPGVAITLTVLAFNLLGDGLRDALDPRAGRLVTRVRADRPPRRRPRQPGGLPARRAG
jgi:peptide/nickel transport system permease protein